ncbi:MAG: HAD hydrolase-like protein [Azonexus sp.]|nr:HAD hydrolase-like protein [Azonexus sp.]
MYASKDRLVIFDVDGTLIDSFYAVERAFALHGMDIGDLQRFQRRRKLLKYLGGLREFPKNLRRQINKESRKQLMRTLTETYRREANFFPGMASLLQALIGAPDVRVGLVSRNVTIEPDETVKIVLKRHNIDHRQLDFLHCIPLGEEKTPTFRALRREFSINPSRSFACGDEYRDYTSAIEAGMSPFVVAYGFEDLERLVEGFHIPDDVISRTPGELSDRIRHTLDLAAPNS